MLHLTSEREYDDLSHQLIEAGAPLNILDHVSDYVTLSCNVLLWVLFAIHDRFQAM